MSCITPIVFVVDDDVSVRESLELMISSGGWRPEIFASAREFLLHPRVLAPSCLVLDVNLPDFNGLDLEKRLAGDQVEIPIIFITGYGDVFPVRRLDKMDLSPTHSVRHQFRFSAPQRKPVGAHSLRRIVGAEIRGRLRRTVVLFHALQQFALLAGPGRRSVAERHRLDRHPHLLH